MVKYRSVTGFNIPPDDKRFEGGKALRDGFASPEIIDELLQAGAIAVVEEPEPGEDAPEESTGDRKTSKKSRRVTEPLSGEEK